MSGLFGGADDASKAAQESAAKARAAYDAKINEAIEQNKQQNILNRGDVEKYYGIGEGYLDPYYKAGTNALDDYLSSLGMGSKSKESLYDRFIKAPGYQFALDQGQKALDRSSAARGRTQSGAAMKEAIQYGQGYASQKFNEFQNQLANLAGMGANIAGQRSQNALNTGQSLANLGQNLITQQSNLRGGQAENAANAELAAGAARQSAYQNQQNMWGNLLGQGIKLGGFLLGSGGTA